MAGIQNNANVQNSIYYKDLQLGKKEQLAGKNLTTENEVDYTNGLSKAEMEQLDTDNNGYLTREEFERGLQGQDYTTTQLNDYWGQIQSAFTQKMSTQNSNNVNSNSGDKINDASLHTKDILNKFATAGGKAAIPDDAMETLLNKLATSENLVLNFDTDEGGNWVNSNFANLTDAVKDSIKAALKGIANDVPDNTLTLHDIGNAQYAYAMLSGNSNNITPENIKIIQKEIDNGILKRQDNTQAANEIVRKLTEKNVNLNVNEVLAILNTGTKAGSNALYFNQAENTINNLRLAAGLDDQMLTANTNTNANTETSTATYTNGKLSETNISANGTDFTTHINYSNGKIASVQVGDKTYNNITTKDDGTVVVKDNTGKEITNLRYVQGTDKLANQFFAGPPSVQVLFDDNGNETLKYITTNDGDSHSTMKSYNKGVYTGKSVTTIDASGKVISKDYDANGKHTLTSTSVLSEDQSVYTSTYTDVDGKFLYEIKTNQNDGSYTVTYPKNVYESIVDHKNDKTITDQEFEEEYGFKRTDVGVKILGNNTEVPQNAAKTIYPDNEFKKILEHKNDTTISNQEFEEEYGFSKSDVGVTVISQSDSLPYENVPSDADYVNGKLHGVNISVNGKDYSAEINYTNDTVSSVTIGGKEYTNITIAATGDIIVKDEAGNTYSQFVFDPNTQKLEEFSIEGTPQILVNYNANGEEKQKFITNKTGENQNTQMIYLNGEYSGKNINTTDETSGITRTMAMGTNNSLAYMTDFDSNGNQIAEYYSDIDYQQIITDKTQMTDSNFEDSYGFAKTDVGKTVFNFDDIEKASDSDKDKYYKMLSTEKQQIYNGLTNTQKDTFILYAKAQGSSPTQAAIENLLSFVQNCVE